MRQLKKYSSTGWIKCYVAKHDANYGGSIYVKLASAIDNSKAVIAILTQKGCASPSGEPRTRICKEGRKENNSAS